MKLPLGPRPEILMQPKNRLSVPEQAQFFRGIERLRTFPDQTFTKLGVGLAGRAAIVGRSLPHQRKMDRLHVGTEQSLDP